MTTNPRITRRAALKTMAAAGLTAPFVYNLSGAAGPN
jgi:hypothetical protein